MITKKAEKYVKFWKSLRKILLVSTHHTTQFLWLCWSSFLLFVQEFASIITVILRDDLKFFTIFWKVNLQSLNFLN